MGEHERLWAPWRIGFILGPREEGCFLCRLPAERADRQNYLLERGSRAFVCLNAFPYTNGHLLVSPYRHAGDFQVLESDEMSEMMQLAQRWMGIMSETMKPHGFNLGMNLGAAAGAGVADHLHLHVVPRWGGDHNFMSTVADIRLINQSLEECFELLAGRAAAR
ncbi:MAG: HIT domain-containing protein [Candidatus Eremiobacterota bacterium]